MTTGADGSFSITGDYTCTPGQQVYLYALGGDPGAGANAAAGLLAVLGSCPAAGNFLNATPYIVMNEVSTVAAAYAFAGFATDATHVSSSGTALAQTGIANAFANAANLATLSTGAALAKTPAGNGTVPQSEINTLANVLAACVNSNGTVTGPTTPTACYTLFTNALSGGTTGMQPTDTATAAINIAHNPGANVGALYGLATANPPFAGGLTSQPNDFTITLAFGSGYLSEPNAIAVDGSGQIWIFGSGSQFIVSEFANSGAEISPSTGYPAGRSSVIGETLAIDPFGNPWIAISGGVLELSSTGSLLSPANGYTGGGISGDSGGITFDSSGNVWVTNRGVLGLSEFGSSGIPISPTGGYPAAGYYGIAGDSGGNVWTLRVGGSLVKASSAGSLLGNYLGGGLNNARDLAIDASGHVWVLNPGGGTGSSLSDFSSAGVALSPSGGFTGGGLSMSILGSTGIAIDGAGNIWVGNAKSVSEFSNSGTALSPSTGFYIPSSSDGVAVDGSGNVWVCTRFGFYELVGAAVPVVTPISVGVRDNKLGTRP